MVIWKILVLTIIAVFGLFGNILAIIVLTKHPGMMGETQKLLINQSVIDGLTSLFILFSNGYIEMAIGAKIYYHNHWFYQLLCKAWNNDTFLWGMLLASTYNLVCVTIERCLKITVPFWYRKYITHNVIQGAIIFTWMFGILFEIITWQFIFTIDVAHMTCVEKEDVHFQIVGGLTVTVEYILPMLCLISCYAVILGKIRKQRKVMQGSGKQNSTTGQASTTFVSNTIRSSQFIGIPVPGQSASLQENTSATVETIVSHMGTSKQKSRVNEKTHQANISHKTLPQKYKSSEMKVIKTLLVVCGVFFLCYAPMFSLIFFGPTLTSELHHLVYTIATMYAFFNCVANPLVYIGMHDIMRKRFLQIIQFWK